ncbi:F-box protein fbw2, partial [Thalictrum thalictroides]
MGELLEQEQVRKWEELDTDCLTNIFGRVGLQELINSVPLVCNSWYKASLDPNCWKILDFRCLHGLAPYKLEFAITRSCGATTKLVFPHHIQHSLYAQKGIHKLLPSPSEYFMELFGKLENLEVLDLGSLAPYMKYILAAISHHCKNFSSLTLAGVLYKKQARAIVDLVPKIKYLDISDSILSGSTLMYILSGCKDLVLLDARRCQGFDAKDPDIVKMASHIKTFLTNGSTKSIDEFNSLNIVNNDEIEDEDNDDEDDSEDTDDEDSME